MGSDVILALLFARYEVRWTVGHLFFIPFISIDSVRIVGFWTHRA